MKRLSLILIIIAIYVVINNNKTNNIIIPNEAIRLRILANSNSTYDQNVKIAVRDEVQKAMYQLLENTKGITEARSTIYNNMSKLDKLVKDKLVKENYELGYNIDFGIHYFPKKMYKGITYNSGNYESLVITLGSGTGNNWWCVLFPPLCLVEAEENDKVEYKFFVQELIEKYL